MDSFELVDENGRLTDRGRETIRLAMRDEATAKNILGQLRRGLMFKVTSMKDMLNEMGSLPPLMDQEHLNDMARKHLEFTAKLGRGLYSDMLTTFDFLDAFAINSIQSNVDIEKTKEAVKELQSDSRITKWLGRTLEDRAKDVTYK